MSSIYQEIILDHYHNPHNYGELKDPTGSVSVSNLLCGDKISMQIQAKNHIIQEIMFYGEGCAISTAAASILTNFAKGKSIQELKKMSPASMISMLGIELSANRVKCALLGLEALKKLIIEKESF